MARGDEGGGRLICRFVLIGLMLGGLQGTVSGLPCGHLCLGRLGAPEPELLARDQARPGPHALPRMAGRPHLWDESIAFVSGVLASQPRQPRDSDPGALLCQRKGHLWGGGAGLGGLRNSRLGSGRPKAGIGSRTGITADPGGLWVPDVPDSDRPGDLRAPGPLEGLWARGLPSHLPARGALQGEGLPLPQARRPGGRRVPPPLAGSGQLFLPRGPH